MSNNNWYGYWEGAPAEEFKEKKPEILKKCFEVLAKQCLEEEIKELDCLNIIIKEQPIDCPFNSTIGLKWHVKDDS